MTSRLAVVVLGLLMASTPAFATVVFDESSDGDLPADETSPQDLGTLPMMDTSSVLGSLDSRPVDPNDPFSTGADDFDVITFTTDQSFTVDLLNTGGVDTTAALFADDGSFLDSASTGTDIFGLTVAGTYRINLLPSVDASQSSYQLDINIVPLPASALLLAPALVGLGIMRRRRAATPA